MTADPLDRMYGLLPAVHRIRDAEQGLPLRDLLRVVTEQVDVVEADLRQLYDNWFVETAQDWVVPYLGDLLGYRPVSEAGDPASASPALARVLVPRREVATTIRAHRRKGTLALLEELAFTVAGWPGRAVEFYRLLAYAQHAQHLGEGRGGLLDLRAAEPLDRLDGPFDGAPHTVDVRRIQSRHRPGRYNIPEVGVFVWRLESYPVTQAPAACIEEVSPSCFTFSVLGNDAPLFARSRPDPDPLRLATEDDLPVPLRRQALAARLDRHYGPDASLAIWAGRRRGRVVTRQLVPPDALVVADLTGWAYRPRRGTVALDPVLGRMAFPPGRAPAGVWVSYHYGFSADIGGGEYARTPPRPAPGTFYQAVARSPAVTRAGRPVPSVEEALRRWDEVRADAPTAVIEILDSEVYTEPIGVTLQRGESLEIRAADRTRPVLYLLDRRRNEPDSLTVTSEPEEGAEPGGCITLDGLLVTGRAVHIAGRLQRVVIRHCTLVPGWGLTADCEPLRPAEPSLELYQTTASIQVERSILGSVQVYQDEVAADPVPVRITDSILDATSPEREAVGAPNWPLAHAVLTLRNCTVLGQVQTHAIALAENTAFVGLVRVARRQLGCLRYCSVPPGSRTPRRHRCQPDTAEAALRAEPQWAASSTAERAARIAAERIRVFPRFTSERYGTPAYAQLAEGCAEEIVRGADDSAEIGAFHDLFQPQRLANLQARLEEFSPARTDIAVITAS